MNKQRVYPKKTVVMLSPSIVFQTRFSHSTIFSGSWDHKGASLALGMESGEVLIKSKTSKSFQRLFCSSNEEPITSLAWSNSGGMIAYATGESEEIFLFDLLTKTRTRLSDPSHIIRHHGQINELAWSPCGKFLSSCGDDQKIIVWDLDKKRGVQSFEGHTDFVNTLLWLPKVNQVVSASSDETICIWDINTGKQKKIFEAHEDIVLSLAFCPQMNLLASGSADRTIILWDLSEKRIIATLEGHTSPVASISFSPDGTLLGSISNRGSLKIWNCKTWELVYSTREKNRINDDSTGDRFCYKIQFSSVDNSIILIGDFGKHFSVISLEKTVTKKIPNTSELVNYVNAKVVLVGESGVGKTGLGLRLKEDKFIPSPGSTHGAQFWQFDLPKRYKKEIGMERIKAEVTLWDLAGQPEYRLVHQLFLDNIDLALLLFDCSDIHEPFRGVPYWAKVLTKHSRNHTVTFLVSSRCDVSPPTVDLKETQGLLEKHGILQYFRTSSQTGEGIQELKDKIFRSIKWQFLPKTSTPKLFQVVREMFFREKENGTILVSFSIILAEVKEKYGQKTVGQEEVETVVSLLQSRGLVYHLSPGPNQNVVLLKPELMNQYASSIIHAARNSVGNIGAIQERDVVIGNFPISGFDRVNASDEKAIIESAVEVLIKNDICFRELGLLVFPSQVNMSLPMASKKPFPDVTYSFFGNVESIYASLVVRLCYTEYFQREEQYRFAAEFSRNGARLGFQIKHAKDDQGELGIYFFPDVSEFDRVTFIRFVTDHLKVKGIEIRESITLVCRRCGKEIENRHAIDARINEGSIDIPCQYCDARVLILRSIEEKYRTDVAYKSKQIELKGRAMKRTSAEVEEFRSDSRFYSKDDSLNSLVILHISDLHLGSKEDALRHFSFLEADIANELKKNSLDFIVISGDIANHSTESEYDAAFVFVDRLLKRFGLGPDKLLVVPGNHDLNWDLSKKAYVFNYRTEDMSPDDHEIHVPAGDAGRLERDEEAYKRRFENFNTHFFKKVFQGREFSADYNKQTILTPFHNEKLLFLCLNSSWQIDNNVQFRKRSSIHMNSIFHCFQEFSPDDYSDFIKIVVGHHPVSGPEAIIDLGFLDFLVVKGFQIYLHGHIHEAIEGYHKYDDKRGVSVIGAGTFGAPAREQKTGIPLQYNLLEVQKKSSRIRVNTRKKERENGPWSADARWQDKKLPKPYYYIPIK